MMALRPEASGDCSVLDKRVCVGSRICAVERAFKSRTDWRLINSSTKHGTGDMWPHLAPLEGTRAIACVHKRQSTQSSKRKLDR